MTDPAVLLVGFNRPDLTQRVIEGIRSFAPSRLYFAVDGPREDQPTDCSACAATRALVDQINWRCRVHTLFREQNLGCRLGVSTAIDWFLEHEAEGVILEDDCLPSSSFFRYCAELLQRYRDDERIMVISGDNFLNGVLKLRYSYYFSRYNHCWGWATWRRAWKFYDRDMDFWPEFKAANALDALADGDIEFARYWRKIFDAAAANEIDSWAYRWTFSCWTQSGLSCLPERNLVRNIGFDARATHTYQIGDWRDSQAAEELGFPLRHPRMLVRNVAADRITDRVCFGIKDKTQGPLSNIIPLIRYVKRFGRPR